jgi:tetratricopeptide (TPR) repeat protein
MRSTYTKHSTQSAKPSVEMQDKLHKLSSQFNHAMSQRDYPLARFSCEEVLKMMPNNMAVLSDYALSLMREGNYQKSYKIYKRIYNSPNRTQASESWLDGLAEVCGWLNKASELQRYGYESLNLSDEQFKQASAEWLPLTPIKPLNTESPYKNIIAFSLYGADPRYCETLIKNVETAKELYPSWVCRIYLDDTVPQHVWVRLQHADAQLVDMTAEKEIPPTLWRFLVMDDISVERFMVRDADSLIAEREQAAVEEWLKSPYYFHHMRDYFTHTDLLLAGMWGGVNGLLSNIEQKIRNFVVQYKGRERFTDQYFLKSVLWSTMRQSILNHDELFNFHQAQPWPTHSPIRWKTTEFHVGSNAGYQSIVGSSSLAEKSMQPINLVIDGIPLTYYVLVRDGQWSLTLPFFLVDDFRAGLIEINAV